MPRGLRRSIAMSAPVSSLMRRTSSPTFLRFGLRRPRQKDGGIAWGTSAPAKAIELRLAFGFLGSRPRAATFPPYERAPPP